MVRDRHLSSSILNKRALSVSLHLFIHKCRGIQPSELQDGIAKISTANAQVLPVQQAVNFLPLSGCQYDI